MRRPWLWAGSLALLLILSFSPAASASDHTLVLEAERLELAAGGEYIRAEGNVVLTYGGLTLRADAAVCRGKKVEAAGAVSFTSPTAALRATRLSVDLASGAVDAEGLEGRLDGYLVRAAALKPTQSGGRSLEGASLTRCDLEVPCYEFRAAKIAMEGRKVTILRAWLVLRGWRLIPLPKITLDLDRLEEWPRLNVGYDERGLYLETSFTMLLRSRFALVLDGEFGTVSGVFLKLAAPWNPGGTTRIEPWLAWTSSTGDAGFGLVVTGPPRSLGGGTATLAGQWTRDADGPEAEATLRWTRPLSAEGNEKISLVTGWRSTPTVSRPLLSIRLASSRRVLADLDLTFSGSYDLVAGGWEGAELAAVRRFHCYFARLGLDLLGGGLRFSGGIRF